MSSAIEKLASQVPSPWSREFKWVISACQYDAFGRTSAGEGSSEGSSEGTSEGLDWRRVLELATTHRVLLQSQKHLAHPEPASCPEEVRTELKARAKRGLHRTLFITAEFLRLVDRLQSAGIPYLTFKGPALSKLAYGDLSGRTFDDIDLLVGSADFLATRKCLAELGYESFEHLTLDQQQFQMHSKGEVLFTNPQGCLIDLHTNLNRGTYGYNVSWGDLWARRQEIGLDGAKLTTFGSIDLSVYLAIHGAKHRWQRLNWILDFVRTLSLCKVQDIVTAANSLGEPKVVTLALQVCQATLGLPADCGRLETPDHSHRMLLTGLQKHLEDGTVPEDRYADLMYLARARQRPLAVLASTFAEITTPHLTDWNAVRLPRALWFCYLFVRPLRLLSKRIMSLLPMKSRRSPESQ